MQTIGATLVRVEDGEVELQLSCRDALRQHTGVIHAGVITALVDSACGYAALTRMPDGADVVSVEFKVNLLAPANGDTLRAVGRVVRSGRTLTVCTGDVFAERDGTAVLVAMMQATMFAVPPAV